MLIKNNYVRKIIKGFIKLAAAMESARTVHVLVYTKYKHHMGQGVQE